MCIRSTRTRLLMYPRRTSPCDSKHTITALLVWRFVPANPHIRPHPISLPGSSNHDCSARSRQPGCRMSTLGSVQVVALSTRLSFKFEIPSAVHHVAPINRRAVKGDISQEADSKTKEGSHPLESGRARAISGRKGGGSLG